MNTKNDVRSRSRTATVDIKTSPASSTRNLPSIVYPFKGNKDIRKAIRLGANVAVIASVLLIIILLVVAILIYHELRETREILTDNGDTE